MSLLGFGTLVAVFGILALVTLAQANEVCTGDVVDPVFCAAAQMRQSIFGGLVVAAIVIGTAILAGAWIVAERGIGSHDTQRSQDTAS